eukprot:1423367-Lingulodinium_polyedra.AAC.1
MRRRAGPAARLTASSLRLGRLRQSPHLSPKVVAMATRRLTREQPGVTPPAPVTEPSTALRWTAGED